MIFPKFPYTDAHQLNLNWILKIFATLRGGRNGQVLTKVANSDYSWQWEDPAAGVASVNGQTGAVVLDASDVGAIPDPAGAAAGDLLAYDGDSWEPIANTFEDVFWATYGSTDSAEIYAAHTAGKECLCKYSGNIYRCYNSINSMAYFSYINENISRVVSVVGSLWSYSSKTLALDSDVHDIPSGGTTGQALTKIDGTDYNVQWSTISGGGAVDSVDGKTGTVTVLPVGGTADQVLAKVDGTDYNVYWKTVSGGGGTQEIYWCTYNTTTYTQVLNAINNNQIPIYLRNSRIYIYAAKFASTIVFVGMYPGGNAFTGTVTTYVGRISSSNVWDEYSKNAIEKPSSPSNGDYLVYNGTNWTNGTIHQIPSGGTANQVLSKVDGTDYNVQWTTPVAGGFSPTLLWTNQSPSNSFSAQVISTITGLTNHTWFMVKYRNFAVNDSQYGMLYAICSASSTTYDMLEFESATNNRNGYRKVRIDNRSGYEEVTFTACTYNDSTNNNYAVPIEIYGL